MRRIPLLLITLLITLFVVGCHSADQGAVKVETSWGNIKQIHYPGDWFTCMSPGCNVYDVDLRPWTDDIAVHTATKDNAPLKVLIKVTGRVNSGKVKEYLSQFGFDQESRHAKRYQIETGAVQTYGRDAIVQHEAYSVFAEQDAIQKFMFDRLKEFYEQQMFSDLVSVQIVDKPTFDNADIEGAASKVVAAQKLKQAAEQYKAAAQTTLEKNQIENQIYSQSPQAFEIRKLEIQRDIAEAWSKHQGTLVFGGNSQIQVPAH